MQCQAPAVRRGHVFAAQTGIGTGLATLARIPAGLFQQGQGHPVCVLQLFEVIRPRVRQRFLGARFAKPGTYALQPPDLARHRLRAGVKAVENRRLAGLGVLGELLAKLLRPQLHHPCALRAQQADDFLLIKHRQNVRRQLAAEDIGTADPDRRLGSRAAWQTLGAILDGRAR